VTTDAKRFERLMVDNNILNEMEKVIAFIKEVSNVNTIGKLEGCAHSRKVTQIILLNSVEMYVAVDEFI
jgi:metal-dependent HD superfamily phosphatase/phosphodiesterase